MEAHFCQNNDNNNTKKKKKKKKKKKNAYDYDYSSIFSSYISSWNCEQEPSGYPT